MMTALLVAWTLAAGDIPPEARVAPPSPPPAKEEEFPAEHRMDVLQCDVRLGVCMVTIQQIDDYVTERARIARELKKLREIKGCAKVEVKPKTVPGFRKERDL